VIGTRVRLISPGPIKNPHHDGKTGVVIAEAARAVKVEIDAKYVQKGFFSTNPKWMWVLRSGVEPE
jgi:ribosomal protein L21E